MPQPLVSIIVPCYNAAPWLGEALDSALAQQGPRTQVIVVDDGSTDDTLAVAQRYEGRGVRILSQANQGLSGARNAALCVATGDYVQYLDADDLISPDKIARQVALLEAAPARSVAIGRWCRFRLDPARARLSPSPLWRDLAPLEYLASVARSGDTVPVHAWLLPRGVVDAAGPFATDVRTMEDHEYFARVVLASSGLRYCEPGMSYYRSFHARTLSKRRDHAASRSMLRAVELIEAHLLGNGGAPERRQIAADYYQWLVYKLYPQHPDLIRAAEARVRALGGSNVRLAMGRRAEALSRLIGWKLVQRMRTWLWSRNIYLGKDDFISD